jgi:hypothetical protein
MLLSPIAQRTAGQQRKVSAIAEVGSLVQGCNTLSTLTQPELDTAARAPGKEPSKLIGSVRGDLVAWRSLRTTPQLRAGRSGIANPKSEMRLAVTAFLDHESPCRHRYGAGVVPAATKLSTVTSSGSRCPLVPCCA